MRFIHTSDWQLGMKGGGLGAAGDLVSRERLKAIDRLLTLAEERQVDFVLAAGDLFEDNQVDQQLVDEVARILAGHKRVEIHAIPGNHDLAGPGSVWNRMALRAVTNLHLHMEPAPVKLAGATLHPFPVKSRYATADPLVDLPRLDPGEGIHLGLAHGHLTTITFGADSEDLKLKLDPAQVTRAGLDYLALGHWHGTRLVKGSDGAVRVAYSGTPEQTSFRETDAGNVLLVEIDGPGAPPKVSPLRVGGLTWLGLDFRFAADPGVDRLAQALSDAKTDFLKLTLTGELPGAAFADLRDLLTTHRQRFQHFVVDESGLRWLIAEGPLDDPLSDAGLAQVDQRLAAAAASEEVLRAARQLLRRLRQEVAR
jgi:DNA repair exonuclease SbcCD nuclease subunit